MSAAGDMLSLKNRVIEILSHVPDPEIPCVSVVDLGIVRDVRGNTLTITPTYSGCPATVAIEHDIRAALDRAELSQVKIKTTLSPPWTTDWISDEGREKLRAYGIAPPPKGAAKPEEVIFATATPNLMVVPSGPLPPNPAELLDLMTRCPGGATTSTCIGAPSRGSARSVTRYCARRCVSARTNIASACGTMSMVRSRRAKRSRPSSM